MIGPLDGNREQVHIWNSFSFLAEKAQKAHEEWLKQKEEESKKIAEKQKKLQAKKTKSEQDKENKEIEKRQKAEEKYKLWLEGKDALLFDAP